MCMLCVLVCVYVCECVYMCVWYVGDVSLGGVCVWYMCVVCVSVCVWGGGVAQAVKSPIFWRMY